MLFGRKDPHKMLPLWRKGVYLNFHVNPKFEQIRKKRLQNVFLKYLWYTFNIFRKQQKEQLQLKQPK